MNQREFTRQPRFLPEMPIGEKNIESPPAMPQKPEISWLTAILPPLTMIGITTLVTISSTQGMLL